MNEREQFLINKIKFLEIAIGLLFLSYMFSLFLWCTK